jgi:hypothetical protein
MSALIVNIAPLELKRMESGRGGVGDSREKIALRPLDKFLK